ncbi:hypothetical protein PFI31113_04981 [Pandoraea fibrosis]|uniref:Uncharacterized protein n=1 Tax=Pandoraea fibrosis TaxID=1891094 RepID=A0A5E4Z4L9_9BURK|nr:hypothetical protein PFI31113_04981 [Pandoraea fibrosis]
MTRTRILAKFNLACRACRRFRAAGKQCDTFHFAINTNTVIGENQLAIRIHENREVSVALDTFMYGQLTTVDSDMVSGALRHMQRANVTLVLVGTVQRIGRIPRSRRQLENAVFREDVVRIVCRFIPHEVGQVLVAPRQPRLLATGRCSTGRRRIELARVLQRCQRLLRGNALHALLLGPQDIRDALLGRERISTVFKEARVSLQFRV